MTSLHTRYRPSKFEEVIGHREVVKSLKKVVADERARAFIFTGPSGVGKTTLARILGYSFAGEKATPTNIVEIDAATNSGADAIRDVVRRAMSRAIGGSPVKAIIVDEAHRLSSAAWTVLLKPIEEPPKHVVWLLCTTEESKIPKTIKTRCLQYDLKPVPEELIFELLLKVVEAEKLEANEDVLEAIAENAGGSPRQALVFLEACAYAENANDARQIMRTAGQSREVIDLCRFLLSGRGQTWLQAMKFVKALEGQDPESIRIVICNYLAAVLVSAKSEEKAVPILGLLECFSKPYNTSDKLAPLLMSIGMALRLDQ